MTKQFRLGVVFLMVSVAVTASAESPECLSAKKQREIISTATHKFLGNLSNSLQIDSRTMRDTYNSYSSNEGKVLGIPYGSFSFINTWAQTTLENAETLSKQDSILKDGFDKLQKLIDACEASK